MLLVGSLKVEELRLQATGRQHYSALYHKL